MASEELSEYHLVPCFFLGNQAFNSLPDSILNMAFPLSAYHPTAAWFCHHPRVFWTASKQVHCIKGNSIIATIQDTKKKTNINSNKKISWKTNIIRSKSSNGWKKAKREQQLYQHQQDSQCYGLNIRIDVSSRWRWKYGNQNVDQWQQNKGKCSKWLGWLFM